MATEKKKLRSEEWFGKSEGWDLYIVHGFEIRVIPMIISAVDL